MPGSGGTLYAMAEVVAGFYMSELIMGWMILLASMDTVWWLYVAMHTLPNLR